MLPCHTPPFQTYIVVQILTNSYKQFFFYLKLTQYTIFFPLKNSMHMEDTSHQTNIVWNPGNS